MASGNGVEALKGTWDYVDGENFEDFLKEVGVGMVMRKVAKNVKPRLTISEKDGKWTLRSESTLKTTTTEFIPGVEFTETTADGQEVTGTVRFENGKWIQMMRDKNGKETVVTRFINDQGQQHVTMDCGKVKAYRLFKRIE
ncbi:unnamed protein product [Didymodactylos carnosus]|uniref:Lipocalin/cytosolic fatty-acid binding domain-containing protein n=1 Tax=Didymodactylos carnosus TaxID=1234261 RepID=A0A815F3M3_9BILA|nr:unnamed protein product [Didymodactylos carnosus]CAF1320326.1 unnamed protein product [Didymodactylos carnosus]CAF3956885.1 unnamed protein product [Didymodactylos carnosus]CAF4165447.1 unnamed protein product [Didymodactylos carnosus]